jgi:hypothetical protein
MMSYAKANTDSLYKIMPFQKIIDIYLQKIRKNPNIFINYLNTIFYLNNSGLNVYKKIRKNPQRICMY